MLLGHWLEMRAISQARGALSAIAALLPDTAELVMYKPGPRYHAKLQKRLQPGSNFPSLGEPPTTTPSPPPSNYPVASAVKNTH